MPEQNLSLSVKVNTETGALEVLGAKLKDVSAQAKGADSSFSGLTGGAKDLLSAFGLVATGAGIFEFFKKAVTEANADAEALRRLQFALETNGVSWKDNKDKLLLWSEGIQETTRFSNTEALEALGRLSKATKDVGQAQEGVRVAMGLAVGAGMDLNSAMDLMNGLMVGNERAVLQAHKQLGAFVGTASTAQGMLDALTAKFGDTAAKEDSFTKSSAQLTNAWDDFSKQVGNAFIPAITGIVEALTWVVQRIDELGAVIAGFAASAVAIFMGLGSAIKEAMIGNFQQATEAVRMMNVDLVSIAQGTADEFTKVENKKTQALMAASGNRTRIVAGASLQEQKAKQDQATKFIEIENDLQKKMDALGVQTLKKKLDALNAESEIKRAQINKEIEDQSKKAQLLVDLERWKSASAVELNREEGQRKIDASFQVANIAVQTLQTINSMSEQDSAAEKARAIALLALQQAIAIGWAWVHAVRIGGPFAPAIAAAETALLVAQFASQVQAIEKSSASSNTQIQSMAINSIPLPGGGQIVTVGNGLNGDLGTIPTGTGGGTDFINLGGASAAAAPSAGGGAGQTVNVNIPQITINVQVDTLEVADRRRILQALADELRTSSVEAIRFAVTSSNLAQTNSQVAV